jgi:translation initiation factor IF-3
MRKSYKFKRRVKQEKKFSYNYKIRAPRVMVIDETNESLGEMDTAEAIKVAEERRFDLVEVSPKAEPPVCRIMDYGSFKYQKEKAAKAQKKLGKTLDVKSIRISMKIGEHDLDTKVKQANKFLEKGHKIKVELILRGREFKHMDIAKETVRVFSQKLEVPTTVEQTVTKQGNKLFTILIPEKTQEQ